MEELHAVATGYLIKEHGYITDYVSVFVKELYVKSENKSYTNDELVEYIKNECKYTYPYSLLHNDNYKVVLYDDVVLENYEIRYIHNRKIVIGEPHCCACMIYLGCVGDEMCGKMENLVFEDKDVIDLIEWKNELVRQNRLSSTVKFALTYSSNKLI